MQLNAKTRRQLHRQNSLYLIGLLFCATMLGWLSQQYIWQLDISYQQRHSLSASSQQLLKQLTQPVSMQVFIQPTTQTARLRDAIRQLAERYQQYKSDFYLEFINPDTNPAMMRQLGISQNGSILLHYGGKQASLQTLNEQSLSNNLQRLLKQQQHWLAFLNGHAERQPYGQANHDYATFSQQLHNRGFKIQTLNLTQQSDIPTNTRVLVIAAPTVDVSTSVIDSIRHYIRQGGNLLWMVEPTDSSNLNSLINTLGITLLSGTIVDANSQRYTGASPDFTVIAEYLQHDLLTNMQTITLFPQARGLQSKPVNDFVHKPLLQTLARSWVETGPIDGTIRLDNHEIVGPVTFGISLQRTLDKTRNEQRIIILGDADFLSNAFIGNGGNLELGVKIFNWLSHEDNQLNITPIYPPDRHLQLSNQYIIISGILFLVLLPIVFFSIGFIIWWQRRRL